MKTNARPISVPFLLVLAFELAFFAVLISQHRIVKGHDAFIHFSLQYYFLNHVVHFGDIPSWIPYMTHGTLSAWWYTLQAGFLQNVLLYSGGMLKPVNFLPIYDLGMFVDEMVLVIGTWLLAQRLFKSPWTSLFACLTTAGSCVWMSQPWFNFHFYYGLPLILYLGHRFLDTLHWRYALAGGNLLVFQLFGNLPYCFPAIALVVFLYFCFYGCLRPRKIPSRKPGFFWAKATGSLLLLALNLALAYGTLSWAARDITNYNFEREINSRVPLEVFLHYGGNQNLSRWFEMASGISPAEDYTLFIGTLSLPLVILGALHLRRRSRHIAGVLAALFLISQGSVVAAGLYYGWPMMQYFRHLSLFAVFIKFFLSLLAAAGFGSLIDARRRKGPFAKTILLAGAFVFIGLSGWLFYLSCHYEKSAELVSSTMKGLIPLGRYEWINHGQQPLIKNVLDAPSMAFRLEKSASLCLVSFFLFLYLYFVPKTAFTKRARLGLLIALLAFQSADLMHYKISEMHVRTAVLKNDHSSLTAFRPLTYFQRRDRYFDMRNPQVRLLWDTVPFPGVLHWSLNAFLFEDELDHPYRTDYWLRPLDKLVRALNHQPIDDLSLRPFGLVPFQGWKFPLVNTGSLKITGTTQDKIQFFSRAWQESDEHIARCLADHDYQGGQLFISAPAGKTFVCPSAQGNDRLRLRYKILRFSANELDVLLRGDVPKGAWMMYSDTWDRYWKAAVNNHPVEVARADLAYKAIPLDEAGHVIRFYFRCPKMSMAYNFFSLNALFWLFAVMYLFKSLL